MGVRGTWIHSVLLLVLWTVPGAASAQAAARDAAAEAERALAERLERALQAPALRGARLGALVVERSDGRVLFERSPDRALVPASNLKVLTAVAAFRALGPTHRLVTGVWADAAPDAEGFVGNLYLRGGGDPSMTSEQWWRLAADLRARGLRGVRGDLVVDDSLFDRKRWHPSWGKPSARAYHAPVGALTANYGAFEVWATPGDAAGAPLGVRVDPPVDYLRVVNRAGTGAPGSARKLVVDREAAADHERVIVTGSLPAGGEPRRVARSVKDPARYAAAVLRLQLEGLGIPVEGTVRRAVVPEGAALLHEFEGFALDEVVRRFLKWSNNAIGESLVKLLGAQEGGGRGTWPGGLGAVRRQLTGLGLPLDGLRLEDGSGLSYENRASPRLLVSALRLAHSSFDFGPEFVTGLPIAAADGTLEKRAGGAAGAVRAKTGLLTRVTGLSGFARGPDGQERVFSVLANGYRGGDRAAMDALDRFVAALVEGAPLAATAAASP